MKDIYTNILERLFRRKRTEQVNMRESLRRYQLGLDVRDFLNNSVILYPQQYNQAHHDWPTIVEMSPAQSFDTIRIEIATMPVRTPSGNLR